jgi:hypothetical protein
MTNHQEINANKGKNERHDKHQQLFSKGNQLFHKSAQMNSSEEAIEAVIHMNAPTCIQPHPQSAHIPILTTNH